MRRQYIFATAAFEFGWEQNEIRLNFNQDGAMVPMLWSQEPHRVYLVFKLSIDGSIVKYVDVADTGPRLNIKTVLSTYGDFHVKDKTAVRTSYL